MSSRLEDYKETLEMMRNVIYAQGKYLAKQTEEWCPGKPEFSLCPELWFWAYPVDNSGYPGMMSISFTPFWTKGQAEVDFWCKKGRIEGNIALLEQEEEHDPDH